MANALYHEARNQPLTAQKSIVADVTLNRAADSLLGGYAAPHSVVTTKLLNVCRIIAKPAQYSWYSKHYRIREPSRYLEALALSRQILGKPYYTVGARRYFNHLSLGIRYETKVKPLRIASLVAY